MRGSKKYITVVLLTFILSVSFQFAYTQNLESPDFLLARNIYLKADSLLDKAVYNCADSLFKISKALFLMEGDRKAPERRAPH